MEVLPVTNSVQSKNQEEVEPLEYPEETAIIENLAKRLEEELRLAKRTHLSPLVEEVLLPNTLTQDVARKMLLLADSEPCGLRGCTLYIEFELKDEKKKISFIKCDPSIPSTYELYLTLRESTHGWNFLPQFLKKMTRGTVMICPDYDLIKKKLYRSDSL